MRLVHSLYHQIEHIWWHTEKPPFLLRVCSPIYKKISGLEQKKRLKKAIAPPLPLISIGNITVGGSGKTPFVLWLVKALQEHGWKPVIVCRGDGGTHTAPVVIQPDDLAQDVGDEAALLFQAGLCPVIAGKNRVQACLMAKDLGNIIVLDDGFQYRQLKRCYDIVLIPSEGVGNQHLLPAGPLRENISSLQRADMIVRTGSTKSTMLSNQKEWSWNTVPLPLRDWSNTNHTAPNKVVAVSAIARPKRFVHSLESLGIEVCSTSFFPDHYAFSNQDIHTLLQLKLPIAITAKDAVKIKNLWPSHEPLWVLEQSFEAEHGLIDTILASLPVGKHDKQC